MNTFFFNNLIQLYYLRHVSNNQEDLYFQFYGIFFMHRYKQSG